MNRAQMLRAICTIGLLVLGVGGCFFEQPVEEQDLLNQEEDWDFDEEREVRGAAVDCTNDESWLPEWEENAARMLDLVNEQRSAGAVCGEEVMAPVDVLEQQLVLQGAARCHTKDMADNRFIAHEGSDGRDEVARAVDAGYGSNFVGENVARGPSGVERIFEALMESPGHCLNIMHSEYEEIGIGYARLSGRGYWTQKFGTRW